MKILHDFRKAYIESLWEQDCTYRHVKKAMARLRELPSGARTRDHATYHSPFLNRSWVRFKKIKMMGVIGVMIGSRRRSGAIFRLCDVGAMFRAIN